MPTTFAHSQQQLAELAESVIALALKEGATNAQVQFSESTGLFIEMRQGRVKSRTRNATSHMSLTVFRGLKEGSTSSTDFSPESLHETVKAACRIAAHTNEDKFNGLADREYLTHSSPELDLWHPWELDELSAITLCHRLEEGISSAGDNVSSNGALIRTGQDSWYVMNSHGFSQGAQQTHHGLSARALAKRGEHSQLEYWGSESCREGSLTKPEAIGLRAGRGALDALNCKQITGSRRCPVLFNPSCAISLLNHLVQSISGPMLYRGNSFLSDKLGEQIFNQHISIEEDPFIPQGLASRGFDGDGVSGMARQIVDKGDLTGFFLSAYAARRLGMTPTGNGWGPGNLIMSSALTHETDDFTEMLRKLNTGLLITGFSSGGPRLISGDYSRSLRGFWVEGGEVRHAVEGITVAGNLMDMYRNIVAVGADRFTENGFTCGSVLIDGLQVAGR